MNTRLFRPFLLPALIAGLGLIPVGRATAQTFTNLYSLNGGSDGAGPGALILSGNTFYGTASSGGSAGAGTVFKVNTNGQNFTTLYTFTNGADGNSPGGLILSGNTLYGGAVRGSSGWGTLFKVNTNGTGFTNFYNFLNGSDGSRPSALIMVSNTLYGTASQGGSAFFGTVFKVNTNGSGFTPLHPFSGQNNGDGSSPSGGLLLSSNILYGTTSGGGTGNAGTVYSINIDGLGYTNLHNLSISSDGAGPRGGLVLVGNTLYGTASGGGSFGDGTVFAVNTNGTGFTNLYSFQGYFFTNAGYVYTGTGPNGGLVLSGNTLYGTAQSGGAGSSGTIFSVLTNGTVFLVRHTFTALTGVNSTNSDGGYPAAGLVLAGNTLYGTTDAGGSSGFGTLFNFSSTPVPLVVTTTSLPALAVDEAFSLTLFASGGQQPYGWTLISGALPANVSPLEANGYTSGFPLTIGTYNFTAQVTDALGVTATQALSLVITNPDTLTVSITNVTAGMVVSNAFPLFTLAGTAVEAGPVQGNVSVYSVFCSANNSAWISFGAPNNSSWAARLYLAPGSNTVAAYALDSAGSVSATNTVTINDVVPSSAIVTAVPGTPVTTNWNPGSNPVQIFEGGGIGVQPLILRIIPNSYPFTALPGDVVFLLNPNGGNNRTNWAAVVNFFNPNDPNGSQGLVATEYQTFFPANPGPNYFAGIPLFPNVVYVPITTTVTNVGIIAFYDETGPIDGIFSGQWGAFELAAAIQPGGFAATIISPTPGEFIGGNAAFTVTGIATITNGQAAVSNVWVQLNGGGWTSATTANGWTNWSAAVTLTSGTNTFAAYAVDQSGNVSVTNSVTFDYVASAPQLTILRSGTNVIVTWLAAGFTLQSTTNLVSPAVWITNSPMPVVISGTNTVTNSISGTRKFYRLSQ